MLGPLKELLGKLSKTPISKIHLSQFIQQLHVKISIAATNSKREKLFKLKGLTTSLSPKIRKLRYLIWSKKHLTTFKITHCFIMLFQAKNHIELSRCSAFCHEKRRFLLQFESHQTIQGKKKSFTSRNKEKKENSDSGSL